MNTYTADLKVQQHPSSCITWNPSWSHPALSEEQRLPMTTSSTPLLLPHLKSFLISFCPFWRAASACDHVFNTPPPASPEILFDLILPFLTSSACLWPCLWLPQAEARGLTDLHIWGCKEYKIKSIISSQAEARGLTDLHIRGCKGI